MRTTLNIERVAGQGDGLARGPDGAVFVPLTLPGEVVEAEVAEDRGEVVELIVASAARVAPPCPHFGDCGGCALQHWAAAPYLDWKRGQVVHALAREGLEVEVSPTAATPAGTRRRVALHARRRMDGTVALGFKARRSWRLVELGTCVIADPRIVRALPALAEVAAAMFEHPKSAPSLHVTVTDSGLDVDVTGVERRTGGGLSGDARARAIAAATAADLARLSLAGEVLFMRRPPVVSFGPARVVLPPGGFLQASPQAEAIMVAEVVAAARGARKIVDLFCGAGTFTFPLAEIAPVLAADAGAEAIAALNAGRRSAPRLKPVTAHARDLFRRPLSPFDLKGCDVAVLDPPRAGAVEQVRQLADARTIERVAYVSCNPVTFARDAAVLVAAGLRLERVLPVDQFLWSGHVELVATFRR
ncbi:MAG: class I SAM-dependent RNA methyltransferase [Alphaproteobacteria bacterium]|nr:class I SAM-dependent RNA methyltransferase [Alphaproteobacteria bacterium]MBU1525692.1 class I SAM-dependent RNA methyltransferase [Alphaproteobacteria bacterium]MBU2351927.1 class I SAM-dependent RNA methyltransferase [Alphaproteobacteria bacterium]MBU2383704.1 class I SAM-dependent RNA methyltransferase [Alphaproteobacteria bacterium]